MTDLDRRQTEAVLETLRGRPEWWMAQHVADQFSPPLSLSRTGYLLDRLLDSLLVERRRRKKTEWGLYTPEGYHRYQYRALTSEDLMKEEETLP
jgi:hypothetical protein